MLESAAKLGSGYEFLLPLAPTIDRSFLESLIGQSAQHSSGARSLTRALPFAGGTIASGTATIEPRLWHTVRNGLPGFSSHLSAGTAAHQGISLRHGQT